MTQIRDRYQQIAGLPTIKGFKEGAGAASFNQISSWRTCAALRAIYSLLENRTNKESGVAASAESVNNKRHRG